MKVPQNILIVRTDRIGDVVLTTPSVRAIRKKYPKSRLSILVVPLTKPLVENNPYLDEIFVDDRSYAHRGLLGFLKLIRLLRSRQFDCVVVYHTKKRTNALCFLAGISRRIGFKNKKLGFLLNEFLVDTRHEGKQHEAQYCLDVLSRIGINASDLDLDICVVDETILQAQIILKNLGVDVNKRIIVIHPGASDPSKMWPINRFAELINQMCTQFECRLVLIGSKQTVQTSSEIVNGVKTQYINEKRVVDLTGQTSLLELSGLLKASFLLISNDSGPVHIGAGVGIPVISIFTRNQPGINPTRWKPLSANSQVISVPLDVDPNFQKAASATSEYLQLIDSKEVFESVRKVFNDFPRVDV